MRLVALIFSGICVLVFILQAIFGTEPFLLIKSLVWDQPWRLLTSIFAHGGIVHLLSNLFALGLFGLILEGRIGPKRVFWLFLITGVLVNIFMPYERSLGASGAIFGIIGALAVLRPKMIVWAGGFPVPMVLAAVIWLFADVFGMFVPSDTGHLAHIGGIAAGVIMGFVWRKEFGDKFFSRKKKDPHLEKQLDEWHDTYMK